MASAAKPKVNPKAAHKSNAPAGQNGVLDRVHAFVNLKFPPTMQELNHVRGSKQVKDIERD